MILTAKIRDNYRYVIGICCFYLFFCKTMQNNRKDTVLLNAVAAKLRQLRMDRGLSQKNVLIDTDIHIGRIEWGKQNISLSTLAILCDYYHISLVEFFMDIPTNTKELWE